MKISKSKKELARIIRESGGWRDGVEFFASTCNGIVIGSKSKPKYTSKYGWVAAGGFIDDRIELHSYLKNWHQTTLSREEYFFLHQNQGLEDALDEPMVEAKPTIEQLASYYRNAKDYAERKQQEADAAKADADAKLKALELAGEAIGLLVSPIAEKQKSELVAAVKVGDQVECVESNIKRDKYNGMVGRMHFIDESDTSTPYLVDFGGAEKIWCHEVKFIRRP